MFLVFPWAFSPRTLFRGEGRDLLHSWAPAFAGVTIKVGGLRNRQGPFADALRALKPIEGHRTSGLSGAIDLRVQ